MPRRSVVGSLEGTHDWGIDHRMEPAAPLTDVDLLQKITARDPEALACLFDRYRRMVHALALRILRNRDEAEETLLDVFHQAWRQASWYDPGRGSVGAWLVTICKSRCFDRLRAQGRRATAETALQREALGSGAGGIASESPEESAEAALKRRRIMGALGALSESQRRAIELAYYGGLSHSEIAARLGEPLGTVKTRIRQAMITLRESLAAQFGE